MRKGVARVCYVLIGMTVAWGIATLTSAVFQCKPIHIAWDPTSTRSECFKLRPYLIGTNVPNVLLDVSILVTPLYPVWQLKLPTQKKILISGVFVLGAWYVFIPTHKINGIIPMLTLRSETAFSIVRLVELTSLDVSDVTWDYLSPIIWSSVEICVGIICACLPVMAPLIPKILCGQTGLRESYDSSGFKLSSPSRATNDFANQNLDRLEDDTADLVPGRHAFMGIRRTTDIVLQKEENIALHTMA